MKPPENTPPSGQRDGKGRFLKGAPSPNPGGRPATPKEVADFWSSHTIEAAEKVVALMRSADDQQDQLRAAMHILDRGLGKPVQAVDLTAHADPPRIGGDPDAARRKLEALIAAEEAARPPALPAVAESEASQ